LTFIFSVVRVRSVGGIDTVTWIMVGLLSFFMFRRTATQAMNAIKANKALFTYRQVKPVDAVLVRSILEGFLVSIVATILLIGAALLGHKVIPDDPLYMLSAFLALWLFGLGFGLIGAVVSELVPEFGKIVGFIMMPMYLVSGVMFPISTVPLPYRAWLLANPVAHGLEAARLGFAVHYHAAPEMDIFYLYYSALVSVFFGLVLHRRFALRLATQ
jgi:capsular polysaccharide transport system permease protein